MTTDNDMCKMGHCKLPSVPNKDICHTCYSKFNGELGAQMSEVVRLMIKRAIERGRYEVEVTKDDIYMVWPSDNRCSIMGTVFTIGGDLDTSPSLDRIDPTLGYLPENIQVISNIANRMKNNATDEQLLKFSHFYIEYYRKWYVQGKMGEDTGTGV